MTLDEAIQHCEEVAENNECIAHSLTKDGWQEHFDNLTQEKETEYKNVRDEMANSCLECAEEHRQLSEWLKELKCQREAWQAIRHDIIELKPEFGDWLIDGDSVKQTVCETVNEALIIIDKHLKEVTTDADSN